jgi:hypothetical protein
LRTGTFFTVADFLIVVLFFTVADFEVVTAFLEVVTFLTEVVFGVGLVEAAKAGLTAKH